MSAPPDISIEEVPPGKREALDKVLEESFTGVYLRHARSTIHDVQVVRALLVDGEPAGLSMLKMIQEGAGYVYYIAVSSGSRQKGIGTKLLVDALKLLSGMGAREVYASVGAENLESNALFRGRGFRKTDYVEVARKYGAFKAISMYRSMFVVPGEILLVKDNLTVSEF